MPSLMQLNLPMLHYMTRTLLFLQEFVTDSCGVFTMNYSEGKACFFKVSCVGYNTKTVAVSNEKFYNVTLQQDNVMLKDVIVEGRSAKIYSCPRGILCGC